ncbi:MAG: NADH-ubiquinone oxidoreductase-F iron-sulfur binding region domain-containing protein [Candidatus Latescibacterota bacterium]
MQRPEARTTGNGRAHGCWEVPGKPDLALLRMLKAGSLALTTAGQEAGIQERIAVLRRERLAQPVVFVGTGTCGLGAGAATVVEAARAYLRGKGVEAELVEVGCIGLCSEEPVLDVQVPDRPRVSFGGLTEEAVPGLLSRVLAGVIPQDGVLGQFRDPRLEAWPGVPFLDEHPFLAPQKRWVLANCGIVDPTSIDEYIARGGFGALASALSAHTPEEVCDIVEKSGLRGRGGAGFPAGTKWKLARHSGAEQRYLICNADEGDPGAFMDRAVGESDPYRLLEGMAIAAYAIGATKAYIYIRAEYPLAVRRLTDAITWARQCGLLGENILGSGFDLDIHIKMGAGAFVCGEETALIHSLEGKRGMPRPRPPYPSTAGVFGKPTVINNVETLANVPGLMTMGWEGFSALGTAQSKGTKVFALSGMVNRTGLVEVPMGTTVRQIVFDIGGGIPGNRRCKAVQIGGPSGGCIPESHLDLPCDYEELKGFGTIMGSGGFVVLDESTCMVDLAKYFMQFIQSESCGKCIPCREGTRRMLEILEAITRSRRKEEGEDALVRFQGVLQLRRLAQVIRSTSLCGLGQSAPNPVLSTLRWFADEYEAHILERRCPAGTCRDLVGAPCQTACPVGTEVWRYVAHIGRGEHEQAYRLIRQANPLPSTCARVCHHPCERTCRAGSTGGEPIAVRALKRFVVDHVDPAAHRAVVKPAARDAARIAVVGSGPSGLAAAHYLSCQGYRVTLFEREGILGGMLTCAIPEYRLPRQVLAREIDALLNENTEVRLGTALGRDVTVDSLLAEGFRAVYLAVGAHQSRRLDVPGEDVEGVHSGIAFLKAYNLQGKELARGRVGVVGGGNSAVDAARVARRHKAVTSVTLFYRRTRQEMPACAEEVEACLEEGVEQRALVTPVRVLAANGRLTGLEVIHNRLGEQDASGRPRPVPVPGTEEQVALDTLIVAIGEQPEAAALEGLPLSRAGTLAINAESYATGRPGVFGGGDVVTGSNTVIDAIAAGKRAVLMIERYLTGRQMRVLPGPVLPGVFVEPVEAGVDIGEIAARAVPPCLTQELRIRSFAEVELCMCEEEAVREARRCLRCDLDFTQPN